MKIAILGPINKNDFHSLIKKNELKRLPSGHGVSPISNLAISLLELGHEVSVITLSPDIKGSKNFVYKNKRLKIYFCQLRHRWLRFFGLLYGKEINNLKKAIQQDNPEIIHANWIYEYAFATYNSKKKYILTNHDVPHVILRHQKTLFRLIRFFMGYISLKRAKIITTPSKYAKLQTKKYTKKPIYVIPNTAIEKKLLTFKIKEKKINKKIKIVMLNNGFTPFKNIKIALKSFKEFNKFSPNSSLHLFGYQMQNGEVPGTNRGSQACYIWAKKNNLHKNVIFNGHVQHVDLIKILHKYDVLLHTSLEETFGTIYIEAMIKGVPIIAGKKSGSTPEIIKNNGLLVDVKKSEEIIKALKKYLQNPNLWKKIRYKAYYNAKSIYNNETIVKEYLKLYKKVLKNPNT